MLTKHQTQDLEKSILGFLISKNYIHSASAFAQECSTLSESDFLTLKDATSEASNPSQINLFLSAGQGSSSNLSSQISNYTQISVIVLLRYSLCSVKADALIKILISIRFKKIPFSV